MPSTAHEGLATARWLLLGSWGLALGGCPRTASESEPSATSSLSGAASASSYHVCNDPEPLAGGWERCANGLRHRPERGECPSILPRAEGIDLLSERFSQAECQHDSDCDAAAHGFCHVAPYGLGDERLECAYGCVVDSECGAREVCQCIEGFIGLCVPAPCATDAECEGDGMCVIDESAQCLAPQSGCQTPHDQCATAADCPGDEVCVPDAAAGGAWRCQLIRCASARP